jgi:hypothetical protein
LRVDIHPYAIAVCGLVNAGLALDVSIAAAAEIKPFGSKTIASRSRRA